MYIKNAKAIPGRGRGKRIGIPTINIDLHDVPKELHHGIYACWIIADSKKYKGAMHYGPRPAFNDTETLEIHIIDDVLTFVPTTVDLEVIGRIRDVENFPTTEALLERIKQDINTARGMLSL